MLRTVLAVAAAQPRRRCGRASIITHHFSHSNNCRRSYIFLPASFSEWQQTLKQAWATNKEKRRAVFVKLLTRVQTPSATSVMPDPTVPLSQTRVMLQRGRPRRRGKESLTARLGDGDATLSKPRTRRRLQARKLLCPPRNLRNARAAITSSKTLKHPASSSRAVPPVVAAAHHKPYSSRMSAFRHDMTQLWNARRTSTRAKWKWATRRIWIDEYCKKEWFDPHGFPRAVRNPYGRFVNPWNSESTNGMHSLLTFFKWRMERLVKVFGATKTTTPPEQQLLPEEKETVVLSPRPTPIGRPPPLDPNKIRLTWIGHSTALVEMQGFTILTDPHFSPRASPWQVWPVGVGRHVPPAMSVEDLPSEINVCVISHDHYDHLDETSVVQLKDRVQLWAVPLGVKAWLQDHCDIDPSRILELTWWERATLRRMSGGKLQLYKEDQDSATSISNTELQDPSALTLVCAPAQHWCGRTVWDRNQRLWCSWSVHAGPLKFYFAGDTGLPPTFPLHRQIGDRLGPFDLAAIPIGAYAPRYFMKSSHVHPEEAVQIHQHVQAKQSVAIHWGTFHLADEDDDEARRLLEEAAKEANVDFVTLSPGGFIETKEQTSTVADVPPLEAVPVMIPRADEEEQSDQENVEYGY